MPSVCIPFSQTLSADTLSKPLVHYRAFRDEKDLRYGISIRYLLILVSTPQKFLQSKHRFCEMDAKECWEAVNFVCTSEFWRMAILWTLSLVMSYFQLFRQRCFYQKQKKYVCSFLPLLPPTTSDPSASDAVTRPVCIITGATSGLGAAAACALSKEGFYIVLAGRSSESLSKAMSDLKRENASACAKVFQVDISSIKSILNFRSSLQQWLLDSNMHSSIQLLINNAGILQTSSRLIAEQYDQMMATNYMGAFCLTKVLLPLLESSPVPSRVVNVTSFTHRNVSDIQVDKETISGIRFSGLSCYPFAHIYEYSKLCLLLFSYELNRQNSLMEKSHWVSIIAADPGAVKTNIMREIPSPISRIAFLSLRILGILQSPENGIRSILDAALAPPEITGVYFFGGNGRTIKSSALSYDTKLSKNLWDASNEMFLDLQLASKATYT